MSARLSLLVDESMATDAEFVLSDLSTRSIKDHFANVFCNILASIAIASDTGNEEILFMLENELDILAEQVMTHYGFSPEEKKSFFAVSSANIN